MFKRNFDVPGSKKIELGLKFKPKRFMDSKKGPFSFSYFFPPPRVELFLHLTLKRRQPRCQIKHIKGETTTKGMKVFSLNYLGGCLNNNKKSGGQKEFTFIAARSKFRLKPVLEPVLEQVWSFKISLMIIQ